MSSEVWASVQAAVPIPADPSAVDAASDALFFELLRTNLMPRQDVPGYHRLWRFLASNDGAHDRAYDVLQQLRGATEGDLSSGELTAKEISRAKKYLRQVTNSLNRLEHDPNQEALGWAGKAADGFSPASRKVMEKLVMAIDEHRDAITDPTGADKRLWSILGEVGLDPRDF